MSATSSGNGYYLITGHVTDANPAGIVVSFDGIPGMQGKSAVVQADGTFSILVVLSTDGSDSGAITAVATDANGAQSSLQWIDVNPTGGN